MLRLHRIVCLALMGFMGLGFANSQAREVYSKVKDSVFTVYVMKDQKTSTARGSAVAIAPNLLATNCHVVLRGGDLVVKDHDRYFRSTVVYQNVGRDLCVIEVSRTADLYPVRVRDSDDVEIGEDVFTIGNPRGREKSISKGLLSNRVPSPEGNWLESDASISFGSSGGGLFDEEGRLIGITTKMSGNYSFALPSEWVTEALREAQINPIKNYSTRYQPAYAKLESIGTYGIDDVELFRNGSECFVVLQGKDHRRVARSLFLWNPKYPRNAILFPTTTDARQAMILVYQLSLDKNAKDEKPRKTSSTVIIEGKPYVLYEASYQNQKYLFYSVYLPKEVADLFGKLSQFEAKIQDKDLRIGYIDLQFGLRGFEFAYDRYQKSCL